MHAEQRPLGLQAKPLPLAYVLVVTREMSPGQPVSVLNNLKIQAAEGEPGTNSLTYGKSLGRYEMAQLHA